MSRQLACNTKDQRQCSHCKTIKPLLEENFSRIVEDMYGFAHTCKSCVNTKNLWRNWERHSTEKLKELHKKYSTLADKLSNEIAARLMRS